VICCQMACLEGNAVDCRTVNGSNQKHWLSKSCLQVTVTVCNQLHPIQMFVQLDCIMLCLAQVQCYACSCMQLPYQHLSRTIQPT
jgi:hypothetical protein